MTLAFTTALALASGGGEVEIVREGAPEVGTLSLCEMLGIIATVGDARARAATLIAARSASSPTMAKSTATAEDYRSNELENPGDMPNGDWVWVLVPGDRLREGVPRHTETTTTTPRAKPLVVRRNGESDGHEPARLHDDDAFVDALAARISAKLDDRLGHGKQEEILLDYARAAERLCTTVAALKARVQRGQMPEGSIVRIGRRVMFKVEALRRAQPSRRKSR